MSKYESPEYHVLTKEDECELRRYTDFYVVEYENSWILNITFIAGNQVKMSMPHGLSGSWATIRSDIVSVRSMFLVDECLGLHEQVIDSLLLFWSHAKKVWRVAFSNNQEMSW